MAVGRASGGAAVRSAATLAVIIKDFAFMIPGPVKAGGTITVRNDDSEIHTFTLDGKTPYPCQGTAPPPGPHPPSPASTR